jgi:hypothetical protein
LGIVTKLIDAHGEVIDQLADPKQTLNIVLPDFQDPDFPALGRYPRYDDALLPAEPMVQFLAELESVVRRAETPQDRDYLRRLSALATRCRDSAGTSLEFLGD